MEQSIVRELGEDQIKRKVLVFFMEYDLLAGSHAAPGLMREIERHGIRVRELSELMCCRDEIRKKIFS